MAVVLVGCGKSPQDESKQGGNSDDYSEPSPAAVQIPKITTNDRTIIEKCFILWGEGHWDKKLDIELLLTELEGTGREEIGKDFGEFLNRQKLIQGNFSKRRNLRDRWDRLLDEQNQRIQAANGLAAIQRAMVPEEVTLKLEAEGKELQAEYDNLFEKHTPADKQFLKKYKEYHSLEFDDL